MHNTSLKKDKNKVSGTVDFTKVPKGHQQHQSGAGKHKDKRRESRQQAKVRLNRESD